MTSNSAALSRFLQRLLLRSSLNQEEQQAILSLPSHARQVRPNHDIIVPGQIVDHSCLIVDGLAARFDQMADGQRQVVASTFRATCVIFTRSYVRQPRGG